MDSVENSESSSNYEMSATLELMEVRRESQSGEQEFSLAEPTQRDEERVSDNPNIETDILYTIEQNPPWPTCILLGLQHYLAFFSGVIGVPLLLAPKLCMESDDPKKADLICTIIFVSGVITLMQTTIGVRLPVVQGGTFWFVVPAISLLDLPEMKCPGGGNATLLQERLSEMSPEEREYEWQYRIRILQGSIIVASLLQVILGMLGVFGMILQMVTPLTIAPMITLVGFSLIVPVKDKCSSNWAVGLMSITLIILFSQYIKDLYVPIPTFDRKEKKFNFKKMQVFKLFPVLLGIVISWGLCAIFTATDVIPKGDRGRTDINKNILDHAPYFMLPYPGQWGWPIVQLNGVVGILAGVMPSAIESLGDYYAAARLSGASRPPAHAINRGMFIEGVGCVLAGWFGTGNGTTTYSENIGILGISKVGSRRVVQTAAVLMIISGVIGKFGAICATIPDPVIGGVLCITFGFIAAIGLSSVQFIDMNSSRNLFILGFSIFTGLAVPNWMKANADKDPINTGSVELDQVLLVLLQTHMLVGGLVGFVLDNTIPGTDEERGLHLWHNVGDESEVASIHSMHDPAAYDLPFGMNYINKWRFLQYCPLSPTYNHDKLMKKLRRKLPCFKQHQPVQARKASFRSTNTD